MDFTFGWIPYQNIWTPYILQIVNLRLPNDLKCIPKHLKRIQYFFYIIVPRQNFLQIWDLDFLKSKRIQIFFYLVDFTFGWMPYQNIRNAHKIFHFYQRNDLKCIPNLPSAEFRFWILPSTEFHTKTSETHTKFSTFTKGCQMPHKWSHAVTGKFPAPFFNIVNFLSSYSIKQIWIHNVGDLTLELCRFDL